MRAYTLQDGSRLLSAQDAATLAGVDTGTIWQWQAERLIGAYATPDGTQYRQADIEAAAAGRPADPPARPSSLLPPGTAARALRVRTRDARHLDQARLADRVAGGRTAPLRRGRDPGAQGTAGERRKGQRGCQLSLRIVPVTFDTACRFVEMWHRHHQAPVGCKFCQGIADEADVLRGVAITGRPVSRAFDNGLTLEVTRSATDGTPNANSMLYGASWQAAKALGYRRLVTYTHTAVAGPLCAGPCDHGSCRIIRLGESGASLRAAGWVVVAERPARPGWNTPSRPRELRGTEGIPRTLWEAV